METVTITVDRLRELELAESQIPIIKEKLKKANHCDIDRINAYNKAHPEKVAERQKRFREKNRDEHNAKRREKYRLKKESLTPPVVVLQPRRLSDAEIPALS
jgi:hypothetical protein